MVANRRRRKRLKARKNNVFPFLVFPLLILLVAISWGLLNLPFPHSEMNNTSSGQTLQEKTSSTHQLPSESTSLPINWEKQSEPIKLPILMYHAIHVMAPEEVANANLIVDPTTFENHLKALQQAGYYTVSPEEAYKILTENVLPSGKKVVWLTFDDSLLDFYTHAYPLLKHYQFKATNNVITGFTENQTPGYLSLEQMQEMQEQGMSFQGHTVSHPDLEYSTIETQKNELITSKHFLDQHLKQDTIALAYPAGRYSTDTISIAEQAGYKLAVTTNNGLATANNGLLSLNRVRVLPTTTAESLLAEISY